MPFQLPFQFHQGEKKKKARESVVGGLLLKGDRDIWKVNTTFFIALPLQAWSHSAYVTRIALLA